MFHVTLRHGRVITIVAVGKQEVLNFECMYSCLSYPACKSRLFYVILFAICGLSGPTIFSHNIS
jgi:hypothetical protein